MDPRSWVQKEQQTKWLEFEKEVKIVQRNTIAILSGCWVIPWVFSCHRALLLFPVHFPRGEITEISISWSGSLQKLSPNISWIKYLYKRSWESTFLSLVLLHILPEPASMALITHTRKVVSVSQIRSCVIWREELFVPPSLLSFFPSTTIHWAPARCHHHLLLAPTLALGLSVFY